MRHEKRIIAKKSGKGGGRKGNLVVVGYDSPFKAEEVNMTASGAVGGGFWGAWEY
jgi:uncharacterized membrane protein